VAIPDLHVRDPHVVLPVLQDLAHQLQAGAHVVVHCRCGIPGHGLAPPRTSAWTKVPDTAEQRE
jgi:hypothetical protein